MYRVVRGKHIAIRERAVFPIAPTDTYIRNVELVTDIIFAAGLIGQGCCISRGCRFIRGSLYILFLNN